MASPGQPRLFMRQLIKKIYKFLFKPFFKNGINIQIGDKGPFRMDYIFAFSSFNRIGRGNHNSGFSRWIMECKGRRKVFDVGAHVGLYTLPASRVISDDGYVYAFEPSGVNRSYLERHLRYNDITNVKVYPLLIGESSGKSVPFYENPYYPDDMNAVNVVKNFKKYREACKKQASLDDFCRDENIIPEVMKIDVEGAEVRVLKGARKMLKESKPIIFLSVHPSRLLALGDSVDTLIELVHNMGYEAYDTSGNRADRLKPQEYILTSPPGDKA